MSQEKAQLIAPQGHFTVPGLNVAGVVTASSFSGNCTGTASSIAQGTNVVVGVMTASSFAGDVFGNAAGLSTTTAGLKLGIVTATSFAGNFTGIGSGLTGTPNIVAGLVTATQFVGNTPGLAAGISAGKNLAAGIVTATTFHGDGSNLTGAGSTAFIRQTVQATDSTTTINLSNGNIIYYEGAADTTVSFANTGTSNDVTIIRTLSSTFDVAYNDSISTAAVDFNGSNQKLELAATADFHFGTDDFTIETFVNRDADTNAYPRVFNFGPYYSSNDSVGLIFDDTDHANKITFFSYRNASQGTVPSNGRILVSTSSVTTSTWYHVAVTRTSGTFRMFIDGVLEDTNSSIPTRDLEDSATNTLAIAGAVDRMVEEPFDGKISNFRIINGTSLYTRTFLPPSAALTNVTNTKLLCCQTAGNAATAAVTPGTVTDTGSPTAASATVAYSGTNTLDLSTSITWPSSITWNGGSAPTLVADTGDVFQVSAQVFNLTTPDAGTTWYGYEEISGVQSNYKLFGWGYNDKGQLGHNNLTAYSSPVQVGSDSTWSSLASQFYTVGAVKSDGTFWTWGSNTYGQLGQNNTGGGFATNSQSSPVQVPGTTWNAFGWGGVGAGKAFNQTKTDGTLWSWGYSAQGGLGQNSTAGCSSPKQIPGTTWKSGGSFQGYYGGGAIRTDGTLWVWGYNQEGSLGQNNRTNYSSPIQIPGTTWKQGSANASGMVATKTDGTLWKWGKGQQGTGLNNVTQYSSPAQIPGTTWNEVTTFQSHYLATKTDGTLWAWGYNANGQLGQNEVQPGDGGYSSPVQIPGTTWRISGISGGATTGSSGAIKTDGTLWVWGENNQGQLGQNSVVNYSSPIQVGSDTDWKYMRFTYAGMIATKGS